MAADAAAEADLVRQMTHLIQLLGSPTYGPAIEKIMREPDDDQHYGLEVWLSDVLDVVPEISEELGQQSSVVLLKLDEAIGEAQRRLMTATSGDDDDFASVRGLSFKPHVHARLSHLPGVPEYSKANVSSIRATDIGRFVQVPGTVIRTGAARVLEAERQYQCTSSKCNFTFTVRSTVEADHTAEVPSACPSPSGTCKGRAFRLLEDTVVRSDYQEVKIQEQMHTLGVGSIPRSIVVALEHDLVDRCKAGDDVVVTGTLTRRWSRISKGARCDLEVLVKANHVRIISDAHAGGIVTDELKEDFEAFWSYFEARGQPLRARNILLRSINPQIHGLFVVKQALALTLAGGVGRVDGQSGTTVRGDAHLLMVGDPGTGKSQFLRYASKITPRSVLTTGVGTTSAGLTCAAIKDGAEWTLEAGALVLADRGVCCIDEFSSIREHDRATIHEAMEQQTISVAKAGLVCNLNARATVIAATNPRGRYDPSADVSVNTAIAPPLLSRFDLVLLLLDKNDAAWDHRVSTFILRNACRKADGSVCEDGGGEAEAVSGARGAARQAVAMARESGRGGDAAGSSGGGARGWGGMTGSQRAERTERTRLDDFRAPPVRELGMGAAASDSHGPAGEARRPEDCDGEDVVTWSTRRMQAFFLYARSTYRPKLTPAAQKVLMEYYTAQRKSDARFHDAARTTIRLLESLVRLAQAHARFMCRREVSLQDAVCTILLVETSMNTAALVGTDSVLRTGFPADPDAEYERQEAEALARLGLSHLRGERPPDPPPPRRPEDREEASRHARGVDDLLGALDAAMHSEQSPPDRSPEHRARGPPSRVPPASSASDARSRAGDAPRPPRRAVVSSSMPPPSARARRRPDDVTKPGAGASPPPRPPSLPGHPAARTARPSHRSPVASDPAPLAEHRQARAAAPPHTLCGDSLPSAGSQASPASPGDPGSPRSRAGAPPAPGWAESPDPDEAESDADGDAAPVRRSPHGARPSLFSPMPDLAASASSSARRPSEGLPRPSAASPSQHPPAPALSASAAIALASQCSDPASPGSRRVAPSASSTQPDIAGTATSGLASATQPDPGGAARLDEAALVLDLDVFGLPAAAPPATHHAPDDVLDILLQSQL